MNCNCISRVNGKLAEAGLEYKLNTSIVFDDEMRGEVRLFVPTVWNDPLKRNRKAPPTMLCTFCPFCGVKAANDDGKENT